MGGNIDDKGTTLVIETLAIVVPIFCAIITTVIGFAIRTLTQNLLLQIQAVAKDVREHRESCTLKEKESRESYNWLSDSIHKVAAHVEVELPDRRY